MTPAVASSLNFRLLSACGCAYDIAPYGCAYTPDTVFSPVVNYSNPPKPICAGTDLINACLVGQNADGIIVAFRGTLPPSLQSAASLLDWLQDFFAEPKAAPNVPGMVHSGFYDATMSIMAGIAAAVQNLNPGPNTPIFVTGHSLGGAMASIAAYILSQTYHLPIKQVVTFASPKPGNAGFQTGYQAVIPNQVRYENYQDIVPLLPPATLFIDLVVALLALIPDVGQDLANLFKSAENWNYVAVGSELFIEADKQTITPDEPIESQVWDVVKEFGEDIWDENFSSFAAAHTISPGGGYYNALSASSAAAAKV
jgi:pimeloyl-ACP methyl ester carboxylesterase